MFKQWKDWTLHWNTRLIQSTSSLIETHHCSVHFFRFLPSFFLSYTSPVSSCGKRTCLNVLVQANVSINSNDLGSDLVLDNQVLVVAYLAWTCFSQFSLSFSKRFRHFFSWSVQLFISFHPFHFCWPHSKTFGLGGEATGAASTPTGPFREFLPRKNAANAANGGRNSSNTRATSWWKVFRSP